MINDKSILTDTDEWFATVLARIDQMVSNGEMQKEQADDMRSRVPSVRAKLAGQGSRDWLDAFNEGCVRNIKGGSFSEKEKTRVIQEISDPGLNALMRLFGSPDWLGATRSIGSHGDTLVDSCTPEELVELRDRSIDARSAVRENLDRLGVAQNMAVLPLQSDTWAAIYGDSGLKTCEKFGKRPESYQEFLQASELQALSISLANREMMARLIGDDCAMKSHQADAVWVKNGMPFVHIKDARWAARLGATSMPKELTGMVRPPWSAFRLAIPQGLLSIELGDAEGVEDCTRIMVLNDSESEWTILLYGSTKTMHLAGHKTEQLCEDVPVEKMNMAHDPGLGLTDRDGRVMRIASRLVLAVCASMDSKEDWPQASLKRLAAPGSVRGAKDPIVRQYVLRPPVRVGIDARQSIRDYIAGSRKGRAPSVQVLVRGHWKNQPHGPGATARKFIHIEPYWRGPEDAPIGVRAHLLKADKEKSCTTM